MYILKKEYRITKKENVFLRELQEKSLNAICEENTRYKFTSKEVIGINNLWFKYIANIENRGFGHDLVKLEKKALNNRSILEVKHNIINNVLLCNTKILNKDVINCLLGVREVYQIIYK